MVRIKPGVTMALKLQLESSLGLHSSSPEAHKNTEAGMIAAAENTEHF